MMISKFIIPMLLLLVKLKAYRQPECQYYFPIHLSYHRLYYLIGDKIKLSNWCTSPWFHLEDKHGQYRTDPKNYKFDEHKGDKDRFFNLGFTEELLDYEDGDLEKPWYNATTTLIIDPALMRYDNETIALELTVHYSDRHWIMPYTIVYLTIVQLKKESRPVAVPNTCPNVTLYCEMEYPVPPEPDRARKWTWEKVEYHGFRTLLNSEKYEIGDDGSLFIDHLLVDDTGVYKCAVHYVEDTKEVTAERIQSRVYLSVWRADDQETEHGNIEGMSGCNQKPPSTEEKPAAKPDDSVKIAYFDMALIALLILVAILVTIAVVLRVTKRLRIRRGV